MANSVVPIANPPMANARMARPRWFFAVLAAADGDAVIVISLLLGGALVAGKCGENPIISLVPWRELRTGM
ncbi:hypothetical protein AAU01_24610 [Paenarthrobacter aurescens]|uniref:Uncharacterized protein n=1 Tax=Paenarthrobacter aurescens TaxID=43663 RepID=A0A4Y3NKK8_PAEAU|nr:hypothetical protein AAU01_24610 [Paenarthrobacter aurescens]